MKIDFYSMKKTELEAWFSSVGEPKFRAKQFFTWLHTGTRVENMTNLSKKLRATIEENMLDTLPKVELKLTSKIDGTVKFERVGKDRKKVSVYAAE